MVPSSVSTHPPPNVLGPQVAPPSLLFAIGSISEVQLRFCLVFAAFLTTSLAFTRYMLPLDDLRSRDTPSKYLRATYSHIYM